MFNVITIAIQANGTISNSSYYHIANKLSNKVTEIQFTLPEDLIDENYFYYVVAINPVTKEQTIVPIQEQKYIIGSNITSTIGSWAFVLLIKETEYVEGDLEDTFVFVSNKFLGIVSENNLLGSYDEDVIDSNITIYFDSLILQIQESEQNIEDIQIDINNKSEIIKINKDIVIENANTVSLNKEATDENKTLTEQYKTTSEEKATIATEQALLAKYHADRAQSIASSIPMRYYRTIIEGMGTISKPIQGDLCYVTDFETGKSQLYVYDTTDWNADEINPEWVFLGNLEFANMDKDTILNLLSLATVAISGSYTDLINKPNRYESFATVTNGLWNYNDSDKIFLTTLNSLTISNMTVGAIGVVITEYNLVLTGLGTVKRSPDYDYITALAGQIYVYTFLNASTYIYITRTVGV